MSDRARAAQIRRLEACLALPENRECFDCGALRPRWASTNLGIFVCMRCAGIHRSLGTHISKVKSINMDVWDEEMIRNCETIGNGPEGKWRYEANMPASYTKPKMTAENREVEGYIRLKFESKAYYPRPDQHGPTAAAVHHEPAHHAPPPATQAHTAAHATAHHAPPAAQPAHPAQGRVIQAVPMETAKPVAQQEPDLFGAFAASRSAPPAQQAAPQPAAAAAAAPKPVANTDFFGQAAAPSSGQAQSPNFFGSPSPPQNGSPDFFGTGPVMQTSHQQQKQHHAPPAPPAPPTDFFSGGAATTNHNQHHDTTAGYLGCTATSAAATAWRRVPLDVPEEPRADSDGYAERSGSVPIARRRAPEDAAEALRATDAVANAPNGSTRADQRSRPVQWLR
jgi:hypothetical protein